MIIVMSWFHRFIIAYPKIVLTAIAALCAFTTYVSLTGRKLPSFEDPQLGFETRGTEISQRVVAWDNLMEESKPSGSLAIDPSELIAAKSSATSFRRKRLVEEDADIAAVTSARNETRDADEARKKKKKSKRRGNKERWAQLKKLVSRKQDEEIYSSEELLRQSYRTNSNFFCDEVQPGYAQLVFSAKPHKNLFSYEAIAELCNVQTLIESLPNYMRQCITLDSGNCCNMWSLPNYVTYLLKLPNCKLITREDVNGTLSLLKGCSTFYHEGKLSPRYKGTDVPRGCLQNRADVYSIMQYIVDVDFLSQDTSDHLTETSIYFPIVKNMMTLNSFHEMETIVSYDSNHLKIAAMDLGLKYSLFDEYLVQDIRYLLLSTVFIIFCAWAYTGCVFLTVLTVTAIFLSLVNAYFLYTFVFGLQFFPFMNILAVIVSLGIGSDDAYIICKVWHHTNKENPQLTKLELVYLVVKHSAVAVFVTTLTTVAAFLSSFWSSVTAVRCFSVFAGLATLINYIFMITWILSGIIISSEWPHIPVLHWSFTRQADVLYENVKSSFDQYIVYCVEKYNALLIGSLGCVSVVSMLAVLVWPRLQVPDSTEFQLFEHKHPFEQYDLIYKERFRFSQAHSEENSLDKLPLRFVWGVEPIDAGSYLDPADRGKLHLDSTFDVAATESQEWLLKFCRRLRMQPFNRVIPGPALSNCFIETFKNWMNRRCIDPVDNTDRYPCCENVTFPYPRRVFNVCVLKAMTSLYSVDSFLSSEVAGPRFLKNSTRKTPKIKALVVEFSSTVSYTTSFEAMNTFYQQVDAWTRAELSSAPAGMKNGWFVSHLAFYDLQRTLVQDTSVSILISMSVALLVLLGVTFNVPLSLIAILTITCIIFVSIFVLIVFGWKLNILESIAISLSIGLSVDFSLHYAVNYKLSPDRSNRRTSVVHSLSMMAVPSLMAAITTGASGVFMLPSAVLPYIQIGIFLAVISSVSWTFATFFQMSLLYRYGPQNQYGQFTFPRLKMPPFAALRKRVLGRRKSNSGGGGGGGGGGGSGGEAKEATACNSSLFRRCTSNPMYSAHELENLSGRDHESKQTKSERLRSESFSLAIAHQECGALKPARRLSYSLEQIPSGASSVTFIQDDECYERSNGSVTNTYVRGSEI